MSKSSIFSFVFLLPNGAQQFLSLTYSKFDYTRLHTISKYVVQHSQRTTVTRRNGKRTRNTTTTEQNRTHDGKQQRKRKRNATNSASRLN